MDDAEKIVNQYIEDIRVKEDYFEPVDVAVYDMLSDITNPLRERFDDEISEYFNNDKSQNKDSTGAELPLCRMQK